MKIYKISLIVLIMIIAKLSFAQADDDKKHLREGIDSLMRQKLISNLALDESTADKFMNTYREENKMVRKIFKEKKELMESIELNPDAADIDTKLEKMLELDGSILDQRKSFFQELQTFLTPQQIAKTIILRRNFEKEIRKEIRKHGENNGRGPKNENN